MLAELISTAVKECLESACRLFQLSVRYSTQELPVVVILSPLDRPCRAANLDRQVLEDLARKLGRPAGTSTLVSVDRGRTGIALALQAAEEQMLRRPAPACVIVGVESFLRQKLVKQYIDEGRVLCGINSNGFIPGEAAAAVLICKSGEAPADELRITGLGQDMEPNGAGGNASVAVTGTGLTNAIRQALTQAGIEYHQLQFSISDLNGERFKFKERTIAAARLDRAPPPGHPRRPRGYMEIWHPVESIGEVGSAIFPCLLGWAFEAGARGYAPGAHALLHASEDNGERVAIVTHFKPRKATF